MMNNSFDNGEEAILFIENKPKTVSVSVPEIDNNKQIIPNGCLDKCCYCCYYEYLNTVEEYECFNQLRDTTQILYNEEDEQHETLLKQFYDEGQDFMTKLQREEEIPWTVYGFQLREPRSDFRASGLHSLKFMLYYMKHFPEQITALFQLNKISFVYVSNMITFNLRCFLLLDKGTKPSSITKQEMRTFVFNLTNNAESLFEIESEIMNYYLMHILSIDPQLITEQYVLNNKTVETIDKAIIICGKALNNSINSPRIFLEVLHELLICNKNKRRE